MMLDGRADDVIAVAHQTEDGEVVCLGPTTGEYDLGRPATEQCGNRLAGALDRCPSLLPVVMNGRSVAEMLGKVGLHGLKHFGQDRGRSVVIKVNAAH